MIVADGSREDHMDSIHEINERIIETLAASEAEKIERIAELSERLTHVEPERDAYRDMAKIALHALHLMTVRYKKARRKLKALGAA